MLDMRLCGVRSLNDDDGVVGHAQERELALVHVSVQVEEDAPIDLASLVLGLPDYPVGDASSLP